MADLYIDADACPVRDEAFRVAERYGLAVLVVTCGNVRVPIHPRIRLVLVEAGADAADDWIALHIGAGDICVTSDVPLAARCLKQGARALGPTGRRFTPDNIGEAGMELIELAPGVSLADIAARTEATYRVAPGLKAA